MDTSITVACRPADQAQAAGDQLDEIPGGAMVT